MTRGPKIIVIESTKTMLYDDLSNIRTALLALVDVAERMMDKKPRTAEIREMHRERRRDEKRIEVLTTDPECGKL